MYISKVSVKNFRAFDSKGISVTLLKGINAIISENNCGKSALIDALRIAFSAALYRKDIYFSFTDFHVDDKGVRSNEAEVDVYFSEVPQDLFSFWNPEDSTKGEFHIRFYTTPAEGGNEKIRYNIWGGPVEGNALTTENFDPFQLFYLGALRDAENELKPSRSGKLSSLLGCIAKTKESRDQILAVLKNANRQIENQKQIQQMQDLINSNLSVIEQDIMKQKIRIGLSEARFEAIAASLRAWLLPRWIMIDDDNPALAELKSLFDDKQWLECSQNNDSGGIYFDSWALTDKSYSETINMALSKELGRAFEIAQNGLGYNNLLFMATVLGDIKSATESTFFSLMLIEEPEAHLHPQLQQLVHSFFESNSDNRNVQIIYTSHSPTLVSRIGVDRISVLFERNHRIDALSFCNSMITDEENTKDKNYLERYLDTTRSQMLFAKGVIFVEGISEAMLLPELAKLVSRSFDKYAVEIVNIDGVAFQPFINLFRFPGTPNRNTMKLAVVTDDDRCTDKISEQYISKDEDYDTDNIVDIVKKLEYSEPSPRFKGIKALCDSAGVKVIGTPKTFEYALACEQNNVPYLLSAIMDVFPQVGRSLFDRTAQCSTLSEKATRIWLFMRERSKAKGEVAQALARRIQRKEVFKAVDGKLIESYSDAGFIVPAGIKDAIAAVTQEIE